jgi:folate-binding protein YgfZ
MVACWQGPAEALATRARTLEAAGAVPLAAEPFEAWRVAAGWPGAPETGPDWNPLEAGLGPAIDFRKGCYIGQEVVARLWYYEKQKRVLVRVRLVGDPGPCPAACDGDAGTLTSAAAGPGGEWRGLAYLRLAAATPGAGLRGGATSGTVLGRVGSDPDAPPPPQRR